MHYHNLNYLNLEAYEVLRQGAGNCVHISLKELERKTAAFFVKNPELQGRVVSLKGLSIEEM